ncbi:MAG: hypothetical protein H6721_02220 [Sandaracinus sp.]|nr:hypothetical protein [Sandaracinus sp.]
MPYEAPTPAATPAPAEEAPVVLILPPGTQVRLLAEELAPPVAPPPAVPPPPVAPAPTVVAPDFAPSIELPRWTCASNARYVSSSANDPASAGL